MRVAVTGAAGYIGSALVKGLVDRGDQVIGIDNLMRGDYGHLKSLGAAAMELIVGDIRRGEVLERAFEDVDAVVHLAALSTVDLCRERPEEAITTNVYGTLQVLEAAKRRGVGRVVFSSSAATYGRPVSMPVDEGHPLRPLNLYGVTKVASEKLMGSYHDNDGVEAVTLRLGNVFGLGLYTHWDGVIPKFVSQAVGGDPLTIYGEGESSRDFVHIDDVVHAVALALEARGIGGEVFNVGGETVKIGHLAEIVSEELERATGEVAEVVHLPPRPGETKELGYRLDKIGGALGYRPRSSVRAGVGQLIAHKLGERGREGGAP